MASTYSNLKFELIGTGDQSGTWGTTTNTNLGTAIEQAIVGMATISSGFVANSLTLTLTDTNAAQNARALVLNLTQALSGAGTLNVPAIQKPYMIINATGQTVTVKVTGQTGVAVPTGTRTFLYNNGTDVGSFFNYADSLTLGTALPITSGGTGTTSTTFVNLATNVTGTLPVANGGTGLTSGTSGGVLYYSATGTLASSGALAANALVIGGGAGVAPATTTTGSGVVTAIGNSTNAASGLAVLNASGNLNVAQGGTGAGTFTANNVLLGNGTSAFQVVAPGTSGNVLTSNGTTWSSTAPAGGGSWVYLSTVTASNAATADVETTFDSTYDAYAIIGTNIYSATDGVLLYCRLKIGGTYQTASSYSYAEYGVSTNSTSMRVYVSTGSAFIQVSSSSGGDGGLNNESTTPGMLTLYTQNPSNASTYKLVTGTYAYVPEDGGPRYTQTEFGGRYHGTAGALTGIRFYASAGNITGTFRLYGIKNS